MRIAVIANGEWDTEWGRKELSKFELLIAADGGGNHVLNSGLIPNVLIGDLDSIEPMNLTKCKEVGTKIIKYSCEKDETDLELALEYAVTQIDKDSKKEIYLYGALGGRVDHLLGNLSLLQTFLKRGYLIKIIDPVHEIWLIRNKEKIKGQKGQKISLIPLLENTKVRTEGLYYPLKNEILQVDSPRGISNVFLGDDAFIEVNGGTLVAVLINAKL